MLNTAIVLLLVLALYCGWQVLRLPASADESAPARILLRPLPGQYKAWPRHIVRALNTIRGPTVRAHRKRPGASRSWAEADTLRLPP